MSDAPYDQLERCFHEPKRLALVSALLGEASQRLTFGELKEACDLTDGNLNRHLKVLEEVGAISTEKVRLGTRPQTFVTLTSRGRADFLEYLKSLEAVLKQAEQAAQSTRRKSAGPEGQASFRTA
ncbi:MAG: transcriptional regulator [Opitutaceae bacterium]|nr:transcriptional regulator [Opitutaceae bacterium]